MCAGHVRLLGSAVVKNSAVSDGGGVYLVDISTMSRVLSPVRRNSPDNIGGGAITTVCV